MIMREVIGAFAIIAAEMFVLAEKNVKRARHAEVHEQHVAGGKIDQEIFGAPAEPGHQLACQAVGEIFCQRPAQIAAANLNPRDAFARHRLFKAAADRFHFRKFRHCSMGAASQGG